MAGNTNNWGGNAPEVDEYGMIVRPMGLKVLYTFDRDCQDRCLARGPPINKIQTIPLDEQTIGIIDLKTCLGAITCHSPELVGDVEKDYMIYTIDYSEPDGPWIGQGMLSQGLGEQGLNGPDGLPKPITGRITKNPLAVIGNGIKDMLEVRMKLTPVLKTNQINPMPSAELQRTSTPTPSENGEWNTFRQSNPNLGPPRGTPTNFTTAAPAPIRPFQPTFEARNDMSMSRPASQGQLPISGSRPGSVEPRAREQGGMTPIPIQAFNAPEQQLIGTREVAIAPAPTKGGGKAQSRPTSRASSRAPTGKPRGRPRKKPLPDQAGSTSGYEDGTDADDGPPRNKKRATMTRVERNNAATFGSVPDSLRVAASTAGALRTFRPISIAADANTSNGGQEVPRAPTPVPDMRFPHQQVRATASSNLRRESIPGPGLDRSFTSSYLDLNRSMTYSQDRSPVESTGVSPSQTYSDEASPADIGSSPPVPRSVLYSAQSSPAPSSPILPPMPIAMPAPDSGFMSGGLEESREEVNKGHKKNTTKIPTTKPPPKPRRSRAKKSQAKTHNDLIIHTETPGPPELLPQTSLYNPPHMSRKNSETARTPVASEPPSLPALPEVFPGVTEPKKVASPEQAEATQGGFSSETPAMNNLVDEQDKQQANDTNHSNYDDPSLTLEGSMEKEHTQPSKEETNSQMVPPALPQPNQGISAEQELPMVPASDPVLPQLSMPTPCSEPPHPDTDGASLADAKSNKNQIKRLTIKQRLEEDVTKGRCPQFCRNCGALETPTWRKIWKQVKQGSPPFVEYSEKPGCITAITILQRDVEGNATLYEVVKKSLGPKDDKTNYAEFLLCNPCGIWFSKFKAHRPEEKWAGDLERLSQTRKRKANGKDGTALPRSKKARAKSDGQTTLTSEACLPTDPFGPPSPKDSVTTDQLQEREREQDGTVQEMGQKMGRDMGPRSSHSRGSGTSGSPIAVEDDLGDTRRLLFPSPRKEGQPKVLGEVSVNLVQTSPEFHGKGDYESGKENSVMNDEPSDMNFADIFGTSPRPSTPPPKTNSSGPFKTPTHPTPSHRPITRSVTRSMRSVRSINSPSQLLGLEGTPTRTPHSGMSKRHSPNDLLSSHLFENQIINTPISRSINEMLSEANNFMMPTPQRAYQLDFSSLQGMEDNDFGGDSNFDFGTLLSTDAPLPSSPPTLREGHHKMGFGRELTYDGDANTSQWTQPGAAIPLDEDGFGA